MFIQFFVCAILCHFSSHLTVLWRNNPSKCPGRWREFLRLQFRLQFFR
jgi:hypothetical protein